MTPKHIAECSDRHLRCDGHPLACVVCDGQQLGAPWCPFKSFAVFLRSDLYQLRNLGLLRISQLTANHITDVSTCFFPKFSLVLRGRMHSRLGLTLPVILRTRVHNVPWEEIAQPSRSPSDEDKLVAALLGRHQQT